MKENIFKNYYFMLRTICSASKYRIILNVFFVAINELFSIFYNVIFFAYFMEAVENKVSMKEIVGKLLFFVIINVMFEIMNSLYAHVYVPKDDIRLSLYLKEMIYNKIINVDIQCFDNSEYYDNVTFALNDLFIRVKSILDNISQFITHILCVLVLIGYFSKVDIVIVLITTISVLTGLVFEPIINKFVYQFKNESLKYDRRFEYIRRISVQYEYAQELRTTNVRNVLLNYMSVACVNVKLLLKKFYKKITAISSVQELIGFGFVSFLVTIISVYKMVVVKSIGIGVFLPLLGAVAQYTWRASSVIRTYNSILNDNIYLNKFNVFYQYKPKVFSAENEKVDSKFTGLDIKHVYFRYDENDDYILKDICMNIRPKKKIALVGYNGAGKTTLINLILRFYDPVQGQILFNDKDIRVYDVEGYQRRYGVVFQDNNIYAASVANNISMDSERYTEEAMNKVFASLHLRESINNLKNGYETQLTHEIDEEGEMLSIGQCQCVALMRMFINPNTQIYILDEPTSALDPIAEEKIFRSINEYLADKTVIYISHRFSASKIADKIYFMEGGKITEEGTHDELINLGGSYEKMFSMQAKYYKNI